MKMLRKYFKGVSQKVVEIAQISANSADYSRMLKSHHITHTVKSNCTAKVLTIFREALHNAKCELT